METKEKQKIRIWHARDVENKLFGTFAVIWDGEKRYLGIALCSEKDQFSRKKGRLIAMGRARFIKNMPEHRRQSDLMYRFTTKNLIDLPLDIYAMIPDHLWLPKESAKNT